MIPNRADLFDKFDQFKLDNVLLERDKLSEKKDGFGLFKGDNIVHNLQSKLLKDTTFENLNISYYDNVLKKWDGSDSVHLQYFYFRDYPIYSPFSMAMDFPTEK